MQTVNEHSITGIAIEQMSETPDARLREIMAAAVKHLHAFAREVDLTPEEWLAGLRFLTAIGQKCTTYRQEFVLLSDTMGLSSLVNALNDKRGTVDSTKSSLVGPFYRENSPAFNLGDLIASPAAKGSHICIYGRITDATGQGIPNARIEIWQTDEEGVYDLQRNSPEEMDLRGTLHADASGNFHLRTVRPTGYLIPMDGPVGDLIRAQRRHGYRPAHIHFLLGAPGYREVTTALYLHNDDHIESDTVFGVTDSLVIQIQENDPQSPFPNLPSIHYDFTLTPARGRQGSGRVGADPSHMSGTKT